MKKYYPLLTGIIIFLTCTGRTDLNTEQARVHSLLNRYVEAWESEDIRLFSEIFSNDENLLVLDGNSSRQFVGWNAFKERLLGHLESFQDIKISFEKERIRIHESGKAAWLSCVFTADFLYQGKPGRMDDLRATWVLEKRNGDWVVVQAHFSFAAE
jgi:uncharacterized protein (TIGR02246 family)